MLPPQRTIATFLPISLSLIYIEDLLELSTWEMKSQIQSSQSSSRLFSTFSFIRKNDATDTAAAPSTICFSTFATSLMPCHQSFCAVIEIFIE